MLRITERQREILRADLLSRWINERVAHVRLAFPAVAANVSDSELRGRIRRCIERAKLHGVTDRSPLVQYVDVCFELGDAFDENAACDVERGILHDRSLDQAARMQLISRHRARRRRFAR
jgi:hypothetical protein